MSKNMKITETDNIRSEQHRLNNLLSKDQTTRKLISKDILSLSCELDKLIVKFYSKRGYKTTTK